MIAYQRCRGCGSVWYFARGFCPRCGAGDPEGLEASGRGTVYAATLVHRAPSEELRAHAPYLVVLVDADEGFRLMAHGEQGLAIGDRVEAGVADLAGHAIPFFARAAP